MMHYNHEIMPLIIQSDGSILLETQHPLFGEVRDRLSRFAELEKSPEYIHTYRISPLSLWNAAAAGMNSTEIIATLKQYSRYEIPLNVLQDLEHNFEKWGKIILEADSNSEQHFILKAQSPEAYTAIKLCQPVQKYLEPSGNNFRLFWTNRGTVKALLIRHGWPVVDQAPLNHGLPLEVFSRFTPRPYQIEAVESVFSSKNTESGFGVVVLPCGSGKTMVGIEAICRLKTQTLILTTNIAAVHQWIDELLSKTNLSPDQVGEYTGATKDIRPITIATYQVLIWRPSKDNDFPHFSLFKENSWGLIIYDEVHLLPAPVFRVVAELQSVRRLGLTATLVREDEQEDYVFSLVGPKRYDKPWKDLEQLGWIAQAICREIRIPITPEYRAILMSGDTRHQFRLASENPNKIKVVKELIANHPNDHILIIGQYLSQLNLIAQELNAPLITGKTPNPQREKIYKDFKEGRLRLIVVSKVANFAIDLPDASMAIQVSGTYGSRQEEAQRLGRILRPKSRNAYFYTLVTSYSVEESYAQQRQRFLTEQGYTYSIEQWGESDVRLME